MTTTTPLDAGVRLRRMRWRLTVFYALATAACVATLAVIAARLDAASGRQALDDELDRRATSLSRAVWIDKGVLHLEPLDEDPLVHGPGSVVVIQVVAGRGMRQRWVRGTRRPDVTDALALASSVAHAEESRLADGHDTAGAALRLAGAPVWGDENVEAAVLVTGDPASWQAAHRVVVWWLVRGCLALVLVAGLAGHLLSGRNIRPAVRTLERQERFLADAAHEIRTPLAALRLAAEVGLHEPQNAEEALRDTVRLADELGGLVTGLLTRARVQATQKVERIPLRLDLLVEQVISDLPVPEARIALIAEPTVVRADPDLVVLAVRNLLLNAVQHGRAREGPGLEVSVAHATVTVRDHGPGIPRAARSQVLRRGVTGSPRNGNGIGLAIVGWVAELHGGAVRIDDADGGGALVALDLRPAAHHGLLMKRRRQ